MVIGNLVRSAAVGLLQSLKLAGLLGPNYFAEQFAEACRKHVAQNGVLRSLARYQSPEGIFWDDLKYKGEAYAAPGWAAYVAEVSVDLNTYAAS
jgi:hypothetical protein